MAHLQPLADTVPSRCGASAENKEPRFVTTLARLHDCIVVPLTSHRYQCCAEHVSCVQ